LAEAEPEQKGYCVKKENSQFQLPDRYPSKDIARRHDLGKQKLADGLRWISCLAPIGTQGTLLVPHQSLCSAGLPCWSALRVRILWNPGILWNGCSFQISHSEISLGSL
jgi:hypothetical protein